jgi:tetrapyrrole methylase family protein/MazG family protein
LGRDRPGITVVGLGPARSDLISSGVAALMASAAPTYVRTLRHPAADGLDRTAVVGFDQLYEAADTFEEVYLAIVEELVAAATRHAPAPIVYAVPGSPLVGERTVELLRRDQRVDVTIVPALSFLDLAWERLGIDPLREGVRLVDAEDFSSQAAGETGPCLVAQCWSQQLLSDIKLSGPADDDETPRPEVVILHHLGLDDEQVVTVSWWDMDKTLPADHLTSLYVPARSGASSAQREMARLEDLVRTLRAQCPWDRAQTHGSLMPHLVEESYEVLDALSAVDEAARSDADSAPAFVHLEEELGDLLFQIVFHACLAAEAGQFTLADVARGVHDKLVHRHPHVFGEVDVESAAEVVTNWEAIKKAEKGRSSVTEGIPLHLPALMLASKLARKASSVGLSDAAVAEEAEGLPARVAELDELARRGEAPSADAPLALHAQAHEALVGEILFAVANLARQLGIDAEQALRARALVVRDGIVAHEAAGVPNRSGTND